MAKAGLSRGLGSLIPQKESLTAQVLPEAENKEGLFEVAVDIIDVNPYQPRRHFSASDLEDLVASIKEHGLLQPPVVTKKDDGRFELIAGERRLRACRSLGIKKIPVISRTASSQQKLELALIENIQRQQLNALEEATAYKALTDEFNLTHDEVAEQVGKSRSEVSNTMRLLNLPDYAKEALIEGKIVRSAARMLLAEPDLAKRRKLFDGMIAGRVTIGDATKAIGPKRKGSRKYGSGDPNLQAHEKKLQEILGTKVEIKERGGKGSVSIYYYSREELLELLSKFADL